MNPYGAPRAALDAGGEEIQPVRLFGVSGRIGRLRYIAYGVGLYVLMLVVAGVFAALLGPVAAGAVWLAFLVLGFMLTIQRCHDFDSPGWLSILMLVPLVNFMFWFIPGTDGPNRYGAPTPPNSTGVVVAACGVPLALVGMVGILAAVALPAYNDYQQRAKVADVLVSATPWRSAVTQHYIATHRFPGSVAELGKEGPPPPGSRYGSVTLGSEGILTLTLSPEMGAMAHKTILLRPRATGPTLEWDCSEGTLPRKYLPARCR